MFRDEARREQVRGMMEQMGKQIRTYLLIKTWLAVLVGHLVVSREISELRALNQNGE